MKHLSKLFNKIQRAHYLLEGYDDSLEQMLDGLEELVDTRLLELENGVDIGGHRVYADRCWLVTKGNLYED